MIWYYFQLLWFVPANSMYIYRFFTRERDLTTFQVKEKYESYWEAFKFWEMNPYKHTAIQDKEDEKTKKPYLPETLLDKLFRVYLFICIQYYLADTLIKIYELKFPQDYLDMCKFGFFLHHLITLIGFKSIFIVDRFHWFMMGPMCYHTTLIAFPNFVLNDAIYLSTFGFFLYGFT